MSEYASKEYSLERTLDKMQGDWMGARFESMPWRATGTFILRALDDIQVCLGFKVWGSGGLGVYGGPPKPNP